jgi:hypothetical protein
MNTWTTIATGLTGLEYTATGLDPKPSEYDFQGIDVVTTTSTTSNVVAVATAEQAARTIQYTSSYPAAATNGMFQDIEPLESATVGNIVDPGRTIASNFNNLSSYTRAAGRTIYGVRVLLGNMSLSPIFGGKLIIGLAQGWNGNWTPNITGIGEQNAITDNLMTGWQRATIGGDPLLPIPAATSRASGMPLRCVWTDWMKIAAGYSIGIPSWDFLTRFLLPPRATAPYALTHANWGAASYERFGVLAGRNDARRRMWVAADSGDPIEDHLRAEGDYVTDPAAAGNIKLVAGQCPPDGANFVQDAYGTPGPTHTPILAIEYSLDPLEA